MATATSRSHTSSSTLLELAHLAATAVEPPLERGDPPGRPQSSGLKAIAPSDLALHQRSWDQLAGDDGHDDRQEDEAGEGPPTCIGDRVDGWHVTSGMSWSSGELAGPSSTSVYHTAPRFTNPACEKSAGGEGLELVAGVPCFALSPAMRSDLLRGPHLALEQQPFDELEGGVTVAWGRRSTAGVLVEELGPGLERLELAVVEIQGR